MALPFLRETGEPELLDDGHARPRTCCALMEARDRALGALKELEFDHRTGKVDDVDYRALVGPLRRQAAEALQALDARSRQRSADEDLDEQEDVQARRSRRRSPTQRRSSRAVLTSAPITSRREVNQTSGIERERDPEREDDL